MLTTITQADFGLGYELFPKSAKLAARLRRETGKESVLIQTDWDFPSLARNLGWSMGPRKLSADHPARHEQGYTHCYHRGTDGTVKCPDCGKSASAFIEEAQEYLDRKCDASYRGLDDYFGDLLS